MKSSRELTPVEKAIEAYRKLYPAQSTEAIGKRLGIPEDYNKAP